jgi:hypothetical protein
MDFVRWVSLYWTYWLEIMHDPWYSVVMGFLCLLLTLVVVVINNHTAQKARTLSAVVTLFTLGWWCVKQQFIISDFASPESFKTTVMTFSLSTFMVMAFWLGYVLLIFLKRGPRRVMLEFAAEVLGKLSGKLKELAKQEHKKPYTKEQYRAIFDDLVVVVDQVVANKIDTNINLAEQQNTESSSTA